MSAAEPYGCKVETYDLNSLRGLGRLRKELLRRQRNHEPLPALIYVMPTFGNPSGDVMSLATRKRLLEIAAEFDILIAEDNPYGSLRYRGKPLPTLLALSRQGRIATVIYLGTVSKTFTPGMRVGWTVAPQELIRMFVQHKENTTGGANALTQLLTSFLV